MPADDWSALPLPWTAPDQSGVESRRGAYDVDPANGGIRREPGLPEHEEIVPERASSRPPEFDVLEDEFDDRRGARRARCGSRCASGASGGDGP